MKIICSALLALVLNPAFSGALLAREGKEKSVNPRFLVGKWEATSKEQHGLTLEFMKDGRVGGQFYRGKVRFHVNGKFELTKETRKEIPFYYLKVRISDPDDRARVNTERMLIQELTKDKLVLRMLPGQREETYKRIK
jgi:uncharacterized protein (TIGR03066 family)